MLQFTPSTITFVLGLLGIMFTVYNYFRDPQIRSDQIDALMKQNLEFISKEFSARFKFLDEQFANLRDNHVHTLETKIDSTNKDMGLMAVEIGKLSTIIEERIPKR